MSGKLTLSVLLLALVLLITVPYLVGFQASDTNFHFGGFLINPVDGNSYLAKMQLGFRGSWNFLLPYTADPGEGAYLFLFYIFLGHIARLTGLSLVAVFHVARIVAALWLLLMICRLLRITFHDNKNFLIGFALAGFGSGLGWVAILGGLFTSDFWVAEAYPFLSMYTNPHFSLGLGLMIYSLLPRSEEGWLKSLLAAVALALIQPFGVVIICLVKITQGFFKFRAERLSLMQLLSQKWFWPSVIYGLAGGVILLYQFAVILSDPILSQWHLQNITPRPGPVDLVISFLPPLALGLLGIRKAWQAERGKIMVIWGAICLVLVFLPWSLQRRFLTGLYLPLAILSVYGLDALKEKTPIAIRYWLICLFFLAVPTNLIVVSSGFQAIKERNPKIFIERGLAESLVWINANAAQDELVLTDPDSGLYVPAWTGRRVVYGHPFETISAAEKLEFVEDLFLAEQDDSYYAAAIDESQSEMVLIGQEGADPFVQWLEENWQLVFQSGQHHIYQKR